MLQKVKNDVSFLQNDFLFCAEVIIRGTNNGDSTFVAEQGGLNVAPATEA